MQGIRFNRSVSSLFAAAAAMALLIAVPGVALGQNVSPQSDQYERGVLGAASAGGPTDPASTTAGGADTLPFTGLDISAIVAIGLGLLAAGLLIRHLARTDTSRA